MRGRESSRVLVGQAGRCVEEGVWVRRGIRGLALYARQMRQYGASWGLSRLVLHLDSEIEWEDTRACLAVDTKSGTNPLSSVANQHLPYTSGSLKN